MEIFRIDIFIHYLLKKSLFQTGRVKFSIMRNEPSPKLRLPVSLFSVLPFMNHVGPENNILIKNIRDSFGKLKQFKPAQIVGKILTQSSESGLSDMLRDQLHQLKGHDVRIERRCIRRKGNRLFKNIV